MAMEFLDAWKENWQPVSRAALAAWMVFYAAFLVHAATSASGFLIIDNANLVVHEAGHLLFGWLGPTLGLLGGTLLQLLVPLLLAVSFSYRRHLPGTAFSAFFFFENFLSVARYMADARRQVLPLVSVGGGDDVDHDWFLIFSQFGGLPHDTSIAAVVRTLGWIGMIATVAWLGVRALRTQTEQGA